MVNLIASENFVSGCFRGSRVGIDQQICRATGYYYGNEIVDKIDLCQERALKVLNYLKDWRVNVQALSGSPANTAVYLFLCRWGK